MDSELKQALDAMEARLMERGARLIERLQEMESKLLAAIHDAKPRPRNLEARE